MGPRRTSTRLETSNDPQQPNDRRYAGGNGFVIEREDAVRVAEHRLAHLGEDHVAALLAEERLPDLFLELPDLLAHGGLGAPDLRRRSVEAAQLLGGHQRAEHIHVEVGVHVVRLF